MNYSVQMSIILRYGVIMFLQYTLISFFLSRFTKKFPKFVKTVYNVVVWMGNGGQRFDSHICSNYRTGVLQIQQYISKFGKYHEKYRKI